MAAAVFSVIPSPVLGGVGIVLFGSVAASGVRTLSKVDYTGNNNMIIVASSLAFGLIPVVSTQFWHAFPDWFVTIFDSGISAAAIVSVVLNLFFNVWLPGTPEQPSNLAAAPALRVQTEELRVLKSGGSLDEHSYEHNPTPVEQGTRARPSGPDES